MNHQLKEHLIRLLKGDGAHLDFDAAVKDVAEANAGKRPRGAEHSPWEVLEHMRICQWDVIQQIADPKHVSPDFPAGYWPSSAAPQNGEAWGKSVEAFRADFAAILRLAEGDLLAPIPHLEGQTILRRLMMLADHTAYHLGELVLLRRMLGDWKEPAA